jgi:hypothetical protein
VDISVDVTPHVDATSEPTLHVRLTNRESRSLSAYRGALPWGNRYSVIVVAVRKGKPNQVLQQVTYIDDPGPQTIELRPGEVLDGDIVLRKFVRNAREETQQHELIVFWSYQLLTNDDRQSERFSGSVLFSPKPEQVGHR